MARMLTFGHIEINWQRIDYVEWDNGPENPAPRVLVYIGGRVEPLVLSGVAYEMFAAEFEGHVMEDYDLPRVVVLGPELYENGRPIRVAGV